MTRRLAAVVLVALCASCGGATVEHVAAPPVTPVAIPLPALVTPAGVNMTDMSFDELTRHLAASHTHDTRDNMISDTARVQLLVDGDLRSWCLEAAVPTYMILHHLGYQVRLVSMLAFTPYADGTIGGHHVVEVWHPDLKRWVVLDIDYDRIFDQPAYTLSRYRNPAVVLDDDAPNPEAPDAYPTVAAGIGYRTGGRPVFDPDAYTTKQIALMEDAGWVPSPDPFLEHFYG